MRKMFLFMLFARRVPGHRARSPAVASTVAPGYACDLGGSNMEDFMLFVEQSSDV
jgi:hypothetical protein